MGKAHCPRGKEDRRVSIGWYFGVMFAYSKTMAIVASNTLDAPIVPLCQFMLLVELGELP